MYVHQARVYIFKQYENCEVVLLTWTKNIHVYFTMNMQGKDKNTNSNVLDNLDKKYLCKISHYNTATFVCVLVILSLMFCVNVESITRGVLAVYLLHTIPRNTKSKYLDRFNFSMNSYPPVNTKHLDVYIFYTNITIFKIFAILQTKKQLSAFEK